MPYCAAACRNTRWHGVNLRRFCLMLHSHGQVTTQRLTTLLNDVGVAISKRQVIRFLTQRLDGFHTENAAGCMPAWCRLPLWTVDDTDALHTNCSFHTTHVGGEPFNAFSHGAVEVAVELFWLCCAATISTMFSMTLPSPFWKTVRRTCPSGAVEHARTAAFCR